MKIYSVGEKVRVRKDLVVGNTYDGVLYCEKMDVLKGQIVTILSVDDEDINDVLYTVEECEYQDYLWSESMFEDVEEDNLLVFTRAEEILWNNFTSNCYFGEIECCDCNLCGCRECIDVRNYFFEKFDLDIMEERDTNPKILFKVEEGL